MRRDLVGESFYQSFNDFLNEELSGSEALYGFGGWLTTRDEPVTMGGKHNCAIVAELIDEFSKQQNLKEPREHWGDDLIPMKED